MENHPSLDDIRHELDSLFKEAGAIAWSVAEAREVEESATEIFGKWLASGCHAGMTYMERYGDIRKDPRLLLEGGRSIICIAFSFHQKEYYPLLAAYAYGEDYHDVLRKRLMPVAAFLKERYNAESRICIDSAPIHERYWAVKSGLGSICRNGALYIQEHGSENFLVEIITTLPIGKKSVAEEESRREKGKTVSREKTGCRGCGLCIRICPGNAIGDNGLIDARKCINYLTIEHRGDWSPEQNEIIRKSGPTIMGCDRCLRICPLNNGKPGANRVDEKRADKENAGEERAGEEKGEITERMEREELLPEFRLKEELRNLKPEDFKEMTQEEFSRLFKGSPVKRAKLAGVKRNLGL